MEKPAGAAKISDLINSFFSELLDFPNGDFQKTSAELLQSILFFV